MKEVYKVMSLVKGFVQISERTFKEPWQAQDAVDDLCKIQKIKAEHFVIPILITEQQYEDKF